MNTYLAIFDKKTQEHFHLVFKWSVSKGRNTYGYKCCSLWDARSEIKLTSCNGGGYDMEGTAFGNWLMLQFPERLQKLNSDKFYGISHYRLSANKLKRLKYGGLNKKTYADGGCGMSSMRRIAKAIKLQFV